MNTILTELQDSVLTLTLNRPPVNALNLEMIQGLRTELKGATINNDVRCVIITGTGRAFCAGHDVEEMLQVQGSEDSYGTHMRTIYNPIILLIRRIEKPVIAAINGSVAGAGLGIALACDFRLVADSALFTVGFSGIGLVPDSGVSLLLPALIGLCRATEVTFTNTPISAEQAFEWGMVNRVIPTDKLAVETATLAQSLTKGATSAFGLTKRAFNKALLPDLEEVLDYEAELQDIASKGEEHQEGIKAFLEKRPPRYS